MSWEGYGQALCKKGHANNIPAHDHEDRGCSWCQEPMAWIHWVDQTNGCYCDQLEKGQVCSAHPLPLEQATPVKYEECPTCQHRKVLEPPTWKIPTDGKNRWENPL